MRASLLSPFLANKCQQPRFYKLRLHFVNCKLTKLKIELTKYKITFKFSYLFDVFTLFTHSFYSCLIHLFLSLLLQTHILFVSLQTCPNHHRRPSINLSSRYILYLAQKYHFYVINLDLMFFGQCPCLTVIKFCCFTISLATTIFIFFGIYLLFKRFKTEQKLFPAFPILSSIPFSSLPLHSIIDLKYYSFLLVVFLFGSISSYIFPVVFFIFIFLFISASTLFNTCMLQLQTSFNVDN